MRWVMRTKNLILALSLALWWIFVNLPWLKVGDVEFTGGQLLPVMNLLPAIGLTALFISLYGRLRRVLIVAIAATLALGVYLTLTSNLSQSAVVIAELERLSGVLNAQSHQAGVSITDGWAKYAAGALALLSVAAAFYSLRAKGSGEAKPEVASESSDNRSLWDEQNR